MHSTYFHFYQLTNIIFTMCIRSPLPISIQPNRSYEKDMLPGTLFQIFQKHFPWSFSFTQSSTIFYAYSSLPFHLPTLKLLPLDTAVLPLSPFYTISNCNPQFRFFLLITLIPHIQILDFIFGD